MTCLAAVAAMTFAACGDSSSGGGSASTSTTASSSASTTTAKQPQTGGVIAYASFQKIQGLDPIVALGGGVVGGIPMNAVYDTLVRWDPQKKDYVNAHSRVGSRQRRRDRVEQAAIIKDIAVVDTLTLKITLTSGAGTL